jgi:hypothetical protein
MQSGWRDGPNGHRTRRLRASMGALAMAGFVCLAACGTPPTPSAEGAVPAAATVERDGLRVTLSISADRVAGGQTLRLRIDALNIGTDRAAYESGGCGPLGAVTIEAPHGVGEAGPIADPPGGDSVDAVLGLAKWSAAPQPNPGLELVRGANVPDDVHVLCTADLGFEDIAPGATFSAQGSWPVRRTDGTPPPAGAYTVSLPFPFAGRATAGEVLADGSEAWRAVKPVTVEVPFRVLPADGPSIDAVEAVDAAIADPRVRAWAAVRLSRTGLEGSTIRWVDGRWRWRIQARDGTVDILVDGGTGRVLDPVPQP